LLAGCTEPYVSTGNEIVAAPPDSISVYKLAGALGLSVAKSSGALAVLRDGRNTVTIYGDPGGQVFVNARPVGPRGGIAPVAGMLFVPSDRLPAIRGAIRPPEKPQPVPVPLEPSVLGHVVLDPGHGGKDDGATSAIGLPEKDVNLAVALAAAEMLRERGVKVTLTRGDDTFIPLDDRAALANRLRVDLFVSIHADWAANRAARGFTVYVSPAARDQAERAAQCILGRLANTGLDNRGLKRQPFRVLVRTTGPAVLVELGYLSNPAEARLLASRAGRRDLAEALADGVVRFLQSR
jgi:N-acetylmuramoyl-L-alanine amidase